MNDATERIEEARPRRFRRYPEYKDSGIEWVGEIPAHWEVMRLGFNATFVVPMRDKPEDLSGDVPWIRIEDFDGQRIRESKSGQGVSASTIQDMNLKVFPVGTVLCSCSCNMGATAIVARPLVSNQTFIGIVAGERLAPEYVYYLMQVAKQHLTTLATGAIQQYLSRDDFSRLRMPLFLRTEQRAIAAFLDRETARIDGLVDRTERLIELLQEKRAVLITRAVTRGLNANVPMKDSDVEWLGAIPAHWEVKRTKFAAMLRSGHTPSRQNPEYWKDCTIPWFGLADVWQIRDGQVEYVTATSEKISEMGLAHSAARLLPKGTVILSRTASVGFSAILGVAMATTQDFVNWVCGPSLQPEYLLYVFRAMGPEFRRVTMGSTHQTIYIPDVGCFSTPVPPVPEQEKIVVFIRKETAKIDTLISNIRQAIDHLKEFRSALISAAVTGKIDVREAAS